MHFLTKSAAVAVIGLLPTTSLADFTGAYGGVAINNFSGDVTSNDLLDGQEDLFGEQVIGGLAIKEDTAIGAFGGYQIQMGNFVYGGEIAITSATDGGIAGIQIEGLDSLTTDIKGRVGYVLNDRVMAYGTAGFSRVDVDLGTFEFASVTGDLEADGFILGAGIDYLATDNIVLGAEFTNRQVEGSFPVDVSFADDIDIDLDVNTLALRAAFKF
ncbi:MAG: outer membrane beta-barrel protein [Pseudomonadota bacterium]